MLYLLMSVAQQNISVPFEKLSVCYFGLVLYKIWNFRV
jgi:hypothetical protein